MFDTVGGNEKEGRRNKKSSSFPWRSIKSALGLGKAKREGKILYQLINLFFLNL